MKRKNRCTEASGIHFRGPSAGHLALIQDPRHAGCLPPNSKEKSVQKRREKTDDILRREVGVFKYTQWKKTSASLKVREMNKKLTCGHVPTLRKTVGGRDLNKNKERRLEKETIRPSSGDLQRRIRKRKMIAQLRSLPWRQGRREAQLLPGGSKGGASRLWRRGPTKYSWGDATGG